MLAVSILHYGDIQSTIISTQSVFEEFSQVAAVPLRIFIPSNGGQEENHKLKKWAEGTFSSVIEVTADSIDKSQSNAIVFPTVSESECVLIFNGENIGFAAGHNTAIALALQSDCSAVWLLNNDATVQTGALHALWEQYSNTNGKNIIGTTVVSASDPEVVQCAGGMQFNPYLTTVSPVFAGEKVEDVVKRQPPQFDYIYGSSMLIPAQAFRDVGLLNEDFFLFYEELDLCRRAQKAGYTLGWCRNAVVAHRDNDEKADSELRIYHSVRSFTLFVRRHYPKYWLVMALVHAAGRSFMQIKAKKVLNVSMVIKGFFQGCTRALKKQCH